jgi:predicted DsbA family dithiol-disulfide isomerase
LAISEAYFLAARNIADPDVLADIAAGYGFDRVEAYAIALDPAQRESVEQEATRSAAAGVRSVPHLVFGGRATIIGGRGEDEIAMAIQSVARAPQAG